jgi:hypothetical protein
MITLKKGQCPFSLEIFFHKNEFWNNLFLQLVTINAYNCPST